MNGRKSFDRNVYCNEFVLLAVQGLEEAMAPQAEALLEAQAARMAAETLQVCCCRRMIPAAGPLGLAVSVTCRRHSATRGFQATPLRMMGPRCIHRT